MVPPSSDQVSRVWPYSGTRAALAVFAYVSLTLSGWLSHTIRLTAWVLKAVRTPEGFLLPVCPLPRSLATTNGISVDVSSSPYLDVSVQAVPLLHLLSFLIQKSLDQRMFAPPQGLSQLTTSFIGSQCQGILLAPFVA